MRLTCTDALAFLQGDRCRRIAQALARDLPGTDANDLLSMATVDLLAYLQRRCPDWFHCPARNGPGRLPCPVGQPHHDESYVARIVRNAAHDVRRWGFHWIGPARGELPDVEERFGAWPPSPVDAAERALWLDRFDELKKRLGAGRPADVLPGVSALRLAVKVEAAELLLRGHAGDVGEALRMVDPGHYGPPDHPGRRPDIHRAHTSRDGRDVKRICALVLPPPSARRGDGDDDEP